MLPALLSNGGETQKKKQRYLHQSFLLVLPCSFSYHTLLLWPGEEACNAVAVGQGVKGSLLPFSKPVGWSRDPYVLIALLVVIQLVEKFNFLYSSFEHAATEFSTAFLLHARLIGRSALISHSSGSMMIRGFGFSFWTIAWPSGASKVVQMNTKSFLLKSQDICRHLKMSFCKRITETGSPKSIKSCGLKDISWHCFFSLL